MASDDPTTEMEPVDSEPCAGCGYPLAMDQRYCLNCGRRRGEPRVDYAPYLDAETSREGANGPAAPLAPAPAAQAPAREQSPVIAVVGISLLAMMLLVGVLIGRGDEDGTEQAAATPTVVTVGEQGTGVADASAAEGAGSAGGSDISAGGDGGGAEKSGGGGGGDAPKGEEGSIDNPEVASRDQLEELDEASGEDYAEASEDLPDTIAIPGEPPPKDNEDPGGGTAATVVK